MVHNLVPWDLMPVLAQDSHSNVNIHQHTGNDSSSHLEAYIEQNS